MPQNMEDEVRKLVQSGMSPVEALYEIKQRPEYGGKIPDYDAALQAAKQDAITYRTLRSPSKYPTSAQELLTPDAETPLHAARGVFDTLASFLPNRSFKENLTRVVAGPLSSAYDMTKMLQGQVEQFQKARQAESAPEAFGRGMAGALPFFGPMAANIAETAVGNEETGPELSRAVGQALPVVGPMLKSALGGKAKTGKKSRMSKEEAIAFGEIGTGLLAFFKGRPGMGATLVSKGWENLKNVGVTQKPKHKPPEVVFPPKPPEPKQYPVPEVKFSEPAKASPAAPKSTKPPPVQWGQRTTATSEAPKMPSVKPPPLKTGGQDILKLMRKPKPKIPGRDPKTGRYTKAE